MKQNDSFLLEETDSGCYLPAFMRNTLDYVCHFEVFSSITHPLKPSKDEPIGHYDLNALRLEPQTQKSADAPAFLYHYSGLCLAFQDVSEHLRLRDYSTDWKTCRSTLVL